MDPELVRHVATTTGLPEAVAERVVADVAAFFSETAAEFVRRRHAELKDLDRRNDEIWERVSEELARRPVAAEALTHRQLRRMVYG